MHRLLLAGVIVPVALFAVELRAQQFATDKANIPGAAAGSRQPTASSTFAEPTVNLGTLVIQGAVDGDAAKQGASFSYTKEDKDDFFQSKFAAFYITPAFKNVGTNTASTLYGLLGVDGQLGTRSKSSTNFLNLRAQLGYSYGWGLVPFDPFSGQKILVRTGPLYEASQDFKIANMLFEGAIAYSNPGIGVGAYRCFNGTRTTSTEGDPLKCGQNNPIEFYFEPRLSLQFGGNIYLNQAAKAFERKSFIGRIVPGISVGLSFPQVAKALNVYSTTLSADDAAYYLPSYGRLKNDLTVSANVEFVPGISIGVSYETGAKPPTFTHDDTVLVALKVKLGTVPFFSH